MFIPGTAELANIGQLPTNKAGIIVQHIRRRLDNTTPCRPPRDELRESVLAHIPAQDEPPSSPIQLQQTHSLAISSSIR